jgi:hypothetical protein
MEEKLSLSPDKRRWSRVEPLRKLPMMKTGELQVCLRNPGKNTWSKRKLRLVKSHMRGKSRIITISTFFRRGVNRAWVFLEKKRDNTS